MRALRSLARHAWLLAAVGAAAACGAPANAGAAGPGFEVVTAQSPADSGTAKSARAVCPDGKRVVGTGGGVGAFVPGLIMTRVVPDTTLTSVTVTGREDGHGTPAQWAARAYAVCATPLPGLVLVSRSAPFDRRPAKSLFVACPSGTRALSAGGWIEGAEGEVLLNTLGVRPSSRKHPERAVIAASAAGTGVTEAWRLHVFGICAAPPAGYAVVQRQSAPGSPPVQPVSGPSCPAGRHVVSVGGYVVFEESQVSLRHLVPATSSVSVFAMEDRDGAPGDWVVSAHAVCA
ncbi:hypothetical protein [Nonomuraea sp. NPDC048826]|uniref:hypothetical protein n=1 Tax=Nonomuraea sp. NPDC048826 TaxID=3364347 RepID=UPI003710205A